MMFLLPPQESINNSINEIFDLPKILQLDFSRNIIFSSNCDIIYNTEH